MHEMRRIVIAALTALFLSGPLAGQGFAAEPTPVATFKDWSVFTRQVDGDLICFAATEAKD